MQDAGAPHGGSRLVRRGIQRARDSADEEGLALKGPRSGENYEDRPVGGVSGPR